MITSLQNEQIKKWRKLHRKKDRDATQTFMVEGFHLVEEACYSNWEVLDIIVEAGVQPPAYCTQLPVTYVSDKVFAHLSQTKSPQGICAIVKMNTPGHELGSKVLLIDAIQDPGNLGTIVRTADAAGFNSVVLGDHSVDIYNDKTIRSTQGSLFHVSVIKQNLYHTIPHLQEQDYAVWGAALEGAQIYHQVSPQEKTALLVGNEGAGIDQSLLEIVDTIVKIPIYGQAESLNVSVAAGILMYYLNS